MSLHLHCFYLSLFLSLSPFLSISFLFFSLFSVFLTISFFYLTFSGSFNSTVHIFLFPLPVSFHLYISLCVFLCFSCLSVSFFHLSLFTVLNLSNSTVVKFDLNPLFRKEFKIWNLNALFSRK